MIGYSLRNPREYPVHESAAELRTRGNPRVNAKSSPGSKNKEEAVEQDQKEVSPGPLVRSIIKTEPEVNGHQGAQQSAESGEQAEQQRYRDESLPGPHLEREELEVWQHQIVY